MPIRILIADDHAIVRQGLRVFLSFDPDLEVVGEAVNGKQAIDLAHNLQPDVVLMDEAFSAIDEFTAEMLREEVAEIHQETSKTFLLVTHNLPEAIELADKIVVLSSRPAQVKRIVDVPLERPRDKTHSHFLNLHRDIFHLLKEELENTIVRHRLRHVPELQGLHDLEQNRERKGAQK